MSRKFTVPIALPGDPTQLLEAVPKQYADLLKNFNFVQDTMPVATNVGQTWWNASTDPLVSGTSWIAVDRGAGVLVWVQYAGAGGQGPQGPQGPMGPPGTNGGTVTTAAQLPFVPAGTIAATNVQAAIQEVATDTATALSAVPWIPLAPYLTNSWVDYGSPYGPAFFRKVGDITYVRGLVQTGAVGSMICTLPVGYRPLYSTIFTCACNGGTVEVRVATTGTIQCTSTLVPATATPTSWLSLSQVFVSTT